MPSFNTSLFLQQAGTGANPIAALQTSFGMPSCMLELTSRILSLLPSDVLGSVKDSAANGANRADDVVRATLGKLRFLNGIIEIETEDGSVDYISAESQNAIDKNDASDLGGISDFLSVLGAAAGFAGNLYNNYNAVKADIESMIDCFQGFRDWLKFSSNAASEEAKELANMSKQEYEDYLKKQYGINVKDVEYAMEVRDKAFALVDEIDSILAARAKDPGLEPLFNGEIPGIEQTNLPTTPVKKEVFRLSFGPPRSTSGRFLLSVDGLYYDSQVSGITPALIEIDNRLNSEIVSNSLWKMEHDPNLGGKGKQLSLNDFKTYVNTILDHNSIDESDTMQRYYRADILLKDLTGQKDRRVYDVSSQIAYLEASGAAQVLISNMRQVLLSEVSHFTEKVNKRKKQIELAVKIPVMYGKRAVNNPGAIPINDFSYLEGINYLVDIEKQKKLVLDQSDVSGVVLPLETKFVQPIQNTEFASIDHLLISNIGIGQLINNDPSSTSGAVLRVNDAVVTDKLISLYNYISFEIESPSSLKYSLFNSAKTGTNLNGKLVAENPREALKSGVGIPFLKGIVDYSESSSTPKMGSYVRMPDAVPLQDLLYNSNGATIDTWTLVPGVLDSSAYNQEVSGLYRLILANENTGSTSSAIQYDNILNMPYNNGTEFTHGLILGFTRDRRITSGQQPDNSDALNPASAACFFLAPTQSFNSSSVGFISRSIDTSENCYAQDGWYNMKVPVNQVTNGVSFSNCGNTFCHVAVTFDPSKDTISIYLDGQAMATSSYEAVFGSYYKTYKNLSFPTPKKNNSFEYNSSSMAFTNSSNLKAGPRLGAYFTPYILGGGYTDGIQTNGFMGGDYGGLISGLKGHLGCTKFYSKPLSGGEVTTNFLANKDFFKNVDVTPLA